MIILVFAALVVVVTILVRIVSTVLPFSFKKVMRVLFIVLGALAICHVVYHEHTRSRTLGPDPDMGLKLYILAVTFSFAAAIALITARVSTAFIKDGTTDDDREAKPIPEERKILLTRNSTDFKRNTLPKAWVMVFVGISTIFSLPAAWYWAYQGPASCWIFLLLCTFPIASVIVCLSASSPELVVRTIICSYAIAAFYVVGAFQLGIAQLIMKMSFPVFVYVLFGTSSGSPPGRSRASTSWPKKNTATTSGSTGGSSTPRA